LKVQYWFWLED